jgi:glutathione S-transferase
VKLFYSPTSPYVRKVMAAAIHRGLAGRIEKVTTNPHQSPPELLAANPLSKVPCLVTDDGFALFDSPVICEYLDSLGEAPPLFPAPNSAHRWHALRMQALADGILDAAVLRRMEKGRPREAARDAVMERQRQAIERGLAFLERDLPGKVLDIGGVAVACALGYLDFRFADEPWRASCPKLAAWYAEVSALPAFAETAPRE